VSTCDKEQIQKENGSYLTANNASTIAQQTLRNKPQTKQLLSISWQSLHRTACKATKYLKHKERNCNYLA